MRRLFVSVALIVGLAGSAAAQIDAMKRRVPEIDPGSAANAVALIAGSLLVLRGRRRT